MHFRKAAIPRNMFSTDRGNQMKFILITNGTLNDRLNEVRTLPSRAEFAIGVYTGEQYRPLATELRKREIEFRVRSLLHRYSAVVVAYAQSLDARKYRLQQRS